MEPINDKNIQYGNLISYCIFIPFLIFINFQTSPKYHWFWWPMLGWGIGVISHGIKTFGIGTDWEVPVDQHDVPLNMVVTEKNIFKR